MKDCRGMSINEGVTEDEEEEGYLSITNLVTVCFCECE
jgi:hypothetical protein